MLLFKTYNKQDAKTPKNFLDNILTNELRTVLRTIFPFVVMMGPLVQHIIFYFSMTKSYLWFYRKYEYILEPEGTVLSDAVCSFVIKIGLLVEVW